MDRTARPRRVLQGPEGGAALLTFWRRRWIPFAALVLLLVGFVLILRPTDTEYRELVTQADAHAEQLKRTAAEAAYREAARLRPDAPLPYLSLARLYREWGRGEGALEAVTDAEQRGAERSEVEHLRTAIYMAMAETSTTAKPAHWQAVVEHARELLSFEPGDRDARHTLARAHLGLREWEPARSLYRELLQSDPYDQRAHERLGALLLGEDPEAVEHLRLAETELSQQLLATFAEAESAGDPAYGNALVGRVLIERDEWALAVRQLELALDRNPGYADAHAYLGHALDQMGYPEDAAPHLLGAIGAAPDSPVAHTLLGLHYERLGDPEAARAQYEAAYDLAPDNPAICVEIGETWAAEGRYVAAEIWLREALSLRPNDPNLWETLTRFYLDHNFTSEYSAVRAARKLLELRPEKATSHDLRGWAAFQVGDYDAAHEHLQRAIELDPGLASAHYHLGLLHTARGRAGEAEDAFTRAIDLDTTGRFRALIRRTREASAGDS